MVFLVLQQRFASALQCIYRDMNESQLLMRISIDENYLWKWSGLSRKGGRSMGSMDLLAILKSFLHTMLDTTYIHGIPGIQHVHVTSMSMYMQHENDLVLQPQVPVIETTGSNLLEVLGTPMVDMTSVYTNDAMQVYHVLGKHAMRQLLMIEFQSHLSDAGTCHIELLVDKMLHLATPTPVNRSGIKKDPSGPLMKSSFETQTQILLEAARFAQRDSCQSVSASVMLGQSGPYGTHAFQVLVDLPRVLAHPHGMSMLHSSATTKKTDNDQLRPSRESQQQQQQQQHHSGGFNVMDSLFD
jgi:hypothetical protein